MGLFTHPQSTSVLHVYGGFRTLPIDEELTTSDLVHSSPTETDTDTYADTENTKHVGGTLSLASLASLLSDHFTKPFYAKRFVYVVPDYAHLRPSDTTPYEWVLPLVPAPPPSYVTDLLPKYQNESTRFKQRILTEQVFRWRSMSMDYLDQYTQPIYIRLCSSRSPSPPPIQRRTRFTRPTQYS